MTLFGKIIGVAFVAVTAYSLLRVEQPQIGRLLIVAAGCLILIILSDSISTVIRTVSSLGKNAGLSSSVFSSLIKIVGIGYLTEFSVSLCNDSDCSSLGKKIELGGKIVILLSAMPIITDIISLLEALL